MSTNIPIQLNRFIGREREVGEVQRLLAGARLLTLTGPGGSGKTRLALEVAARLQDAHEGEVAWVDLTPVPDGALVAQAVAKALGLTEQPDREVSEAIAAHLGNQKFLLIVDNCEHLAGACARLVAALLRACAGLQVLATSRESLALEGETLYAVPALSFPADGTLAKMGATETPSPDVLEAFARYEAIRLFVDRAAAIAPGYGLTAQNARAIAAICRRLDGMPLAIELAAARAKVLTAEQIARRLDDQFALLVSDKRDGIAPRHQSLRATFDWSYELLSAAEKKILRRLSVFANGFTLKAAEAVCSGDGVERAQLLPLLSSLVNKSLVVADIARRDEARYSLLETIRQYAAEQLAVAGEGATVRDRHLRHFLEVTEEVEPRLKGAYQQLWLNWLEAEVGNIRAAFSWALESEQIEAGLRLASAVYLLWAIRGYVEEGAAWLARLLAAADDGVSPAVRANALASAAFLAIFRKDSTAQAEYGHEAARLAQEEGDVGKPALAWALFAQFVAASAAGDYEAEYGLSQRIIALHRELGDDYLLGVALAASSTAAMNVGNYAEARARLEEALALLQKTGDAHRIGMTLNFCGDLERCEKNYAQAREYFEASISMLREVDADRDLASVKHNLGHACLHLGDVERAHSLFSESMATHQAQQNEPGMAECLIGFAALAISSGSAADGARLLAAARNLGGEKLIVPWPATRMEYKHYLAQAEGQLGAQALQLEQIAAAALSIEQAVMEAQEIGRKAMAARQRARQLDELTPREREVAALIAQAKTNAEIADMLVVSKRTVESHIANIRSKLQFTERTQIVRWAIESGLIAEI